MPQPATTAAVRPPTRVPALITAALLLSACASQPATQTTELADVPTTAATAQAEGDVDTVATQAEMVCRLEAQTGQRRQRRVCYTRDELASQREASQRWLRSNERSAQPGDWPDTKD